MNHPFTRWAPSWAPAYAAQVVGKWILGVAVVSLLVQLALLAVVYLFGVAYVDAHTAATNPSSGPSSSDCSVAPGLRPPGCPPTN